MGFKVTIRRNGAVCGEAHYTSEAVAAGIADKAAKTNPDVSTVVTRCNGAGCGCGVKANRRRTSTRAASDSMFALEATIRQTEAMLPAAAVRAAREESGWSSGVMVMASRSEMESYLRELRRALKANPRRNGTTSANAAASRSLVHREGLLRNGAARPTFAAVQKRIFNEFAAEGWTMSSPTLKVPHATSPDGKCRAWFKAQSIYFSRGGGKHELNTAHSALPGVDLRDIRPGAFVAWFEKNCCAPYVHRTNGVRRRVVRRRNSGSMTEAQASTLLRQMGGMGKLTAMIGASGFGRGTTDGHPSLTFKFKGSKKANVVTIILDPSDTYTLRFVKMGSAATFYKVTPTGEFSGVYADALKPTFERFTGLYLSL